MSTLNYVNTDASAALQVLVPTLTDDLVIVVLSSFLYGAWSHAVRVHLDAHKSHRNSYTPCGHVHVHPHVRVFSFALSLLQKTDTCASRQLSRGETNRTQATASRHSYPLRVICRVLGGDTWFRCQFQQGPFQRSRRIILVILLIARRREAYPGTRDMVLYHVGRVHRQCTSFLAIHALRALTTFVLEPL